MATRKYLCGVPREYCSAPLVAASAMMEGFDKRFKAHASPQEAFRCMRRYLVNVKGAEQVGSREFRIPGEDGIRVLTKKSRYGAEVRVGKYSNRYMPGGPHAGGLVVGH
jgi:hypothetical protein